MSGDRYLLDTNAVIQLFDGNCDIARTARANNLSVLTADDHFKKLKAPWKVRFYATVSA